MPRGGKRIGAGRPPGSRNAATLEREAVLRAYRERVCAQAQRLLDAELTVAQGCTFLFRKPKDGKTERVTDEETIRRYLDGELEQAEGEYFYLVAEKPDTLTIRGMFDRTFDKPAQAVTGANGGPLQLMSRVVHEHIGLLPSPEPDKAS